MLEKLLAPYPVECSILLSIFIREIQFLLSPFFSHWLYNIWLCCCGSSHFNLFLSFSKFLKGFWLSSKIYIILFLTRILNDCKLITARTQSPNSGLWTKVRKCYLPVSCVCRIYISVSFNNLSHCVISWGSIL